MAVCRCHGGRGHGRLRKQGCRCPHQAGEQLQFQQLAQADVWRIQGQHAFKALELYPAPEKPEGNDIDAASTLHKFSAGAIYKDILPDVDLEYIISGGTVKENIIIKDASDSYTYTFELKLHGLTPSVDADGNILLQDETTGKTQLIIPAGYMYDANGAYSDAVTYNVTHKNGKKYTLTVTVDADWVNADERAFPVTVDPTVEKSPIVYDWIDYVFINSASPNINRNHKIIVGYGLADGSQETHAILRLQNPINTFLNTDNAHILSATLQLFPAELKATAESIEIGVYEILEPISEIDLENITWGNAPQSSNIACDTAIAQENTLFSLNITSIVQNWYVSGENNGLILKPAQPSPNTTLYMEFTLECNPIIIVHYEVTNYDKLGTWDNYGGIGNISVSANSYNGGVRVEMFDISSAGNLMGIDVYHVYDSLNLLDNTSATSIFGMPLGKGWTLNILEHIWVYYDDDYIVHQDSMGNEAVFLLDNDRTNETVDVFTLPATTAYIEIVNRSVATLYDGYGGKKTFDAVSGKIMSICDAHGNTAAFYYENNRLQSISITPLNSPSSQEITFSYKNNVLSSISNSVTQESVSFEYASTYGGTANPSANTYLKHVIYSTGKTYSFIYNAGGNIQYIQDITNEVYNREIQINYTNRSFPVTDTKKAVSSILARTTKGVASTVSFEYHKNLTITTVNGIDLYSAFDDHGNTIRQYYTNLSYASYPFFTFCTTNVFQNNQLRFQASYEGYDNTVANPSFNAQTSWTTSHGGQYTTTNFLGSTSNVMRITGNESSIKYSVQSISGSRLGSGQAFLLSGWVKAVNSLSVDDIAPYSNPSFGLSIVVRYSDNSSEEFRVNANAGYDDWQYISTIVILKKSASNVQNVNLFCSYDYNTTGSYAYFNNINFSPAILTEYEYNDNGTVKTISTPYSTQSYSYENNHISNGFSTQKDSNGNAIFNKNTSYTYENVNDLKTIEEDGTLTTYHYNVRGNVTSTIVKDLTTEEQIRTINSYNNYGQTIGLSTDERGKNTFYYYNDKYQLVKLEDPLCNTTIYSYDYYDAAENVYKDIVYLDGNNNEIRENNESYIEIIKNSVDKSKSDVILANGTMYYFGYDLDNNVTSIGIEGLASMIASYEYNAKNQLQQETLGNSYSTSYTYNSLNNISSVTRVDASGNTNTLSYYYTADGLIESIHDSATGKKHKYEYDRYDRVTRFYLTDISTSPQQTVYLTVEYDYDDFSRIDSITESCSEYTNTYVYEYRNDTDIITAITINDAYQLEYEYDNLQRLQSQTLTKIAGNDTIKEIEYDYILNGSFTTRYISTIGLGNGTLLYSYTNNGNVESVCDSTTSQTISYQYDQLGQLVRENNPYLNTTFVYEYDIAGNVTARKQFAYTTGTLGAALSVKSYSYTNGNRLSNSNGATISYDNAGNPLTWNGNNLTWRGSLLTKYRGSNAVDFEYDTFGARTEKINYGTATITSYLYDAGGRLLHEKRAAPTYLTECNLVYQYDSSGQIFGFTYYPNSGSPSQYFFGKNAQGDVICIYNASGTTVARYNYDAWGACTIEYDNTSIGIANINPIRYRSYYYDTETSLYYLQSRYYDPAVGRFISPDDASYLGANGDLLSYNLYAYCSNNPVNYRDSTGHAWESIFDILSLGASILEVAFNPLDPFAWLGLAGDAIDLIPFVTAVGETIRALKAGDAIFDGADNAIDTYRTLRIINNGNSLEVHHILEKRFITKSELVNIDVNDMLSVALNHAEHLEYTRQWRMLLPYGAKYQKIDVLKNAISIYRDNPQLLGVVIYTLTLN